MNADRRWTLDPAATTATHRFGAEDQPVLVVDGAMREPAALVAFAADHATFAPASAHRSHYPGLLAPAPLGYVETLVRALDPLLRTAFALGAVKLVRAQCVFSLVTRPPGALEQDQRVPHVDTTDPLQFAILHFLCDAAFGGTAFYRHRATGFETIDQARAAGYRATLDAELQRHPPPAAYVGADTPLFARTGLIPARFDRVIAYRSRLLHSGVVDDPAMLSPDPRRGRLTANIFLNYRAVDAA